MSDSIDTAAASAAGGAQAPAAAASTPASAKKKDTVSDDGFASTLKKLTKPAADDQITAAAAGTHYGTIDAGTHKGLSVNQSTNARAGMLFELVKRDGHTYHVYDDHLVVEIQRHKPVSTTAATAPAATSAS